MKAAHQDDRDGGHRAVRAQTSGQLDATDARHLDVGQDEIRTMRVRGREGFLAILCLDELVALPAEDRGEQLPGPFVVIGDEDAGRSLWRAGLQCCSIARSCTDEDRTRLISSCVGSRRSIQRSSTISRRD